MREIKFRAWDKENKKMIIGNMPTFHYSSEDFNQTTSLAIQLDGTIVCQDDTMYYPSISKYKNDVILMQFTGIQDKNGKDIYEGDIVSYKTFYFGKEKDCTRTVQWSQWESDDFGQPECIGFFNIDSNMTVIGNIHQTPELLN